MGGRSRAATIDFASVRPFSQGVLEEVEKDILLADLSEWVQNKTAPKSSSDFDVRTYDCISCVRVRWRACV
jgi:hypothetical protein